ncbi:MAG: Cdc6/Cdc18 family protein [Candidatus Nanohaloarchaea archaeon]
MGRIIRDARVFTEDYVPKKLAHRMDRVSSIAESLRPLLEDRPPANTLLYGPPGTGKTVLSRFVAEELRKESPEVSYTRINGFKQPSRFEIFYQAVNSVRSFVNRDSYSTEQLVEEFEEIARKRPFIFIVDELDQFEDTSALFDIARFRTSGLVFISNSRDVFDDFPRSIRSRFSGLNYVKFEPYREDQLFDIIEDRAAKGLRDGSWSDELVQKIASNADGDARIAIQSLLNAAQEAESEDLEEIPAEMADSSFSRTVSERKEEVMEKLNSHQRALYEALEDEEELTSSELKERYRTLVDEPRSGRQVRRYLRKMSDYGLIDLHGEGRGRSYSIR